MKKYKVTADQIYAYAAGHNGESVITFPLSGNVPVYNKDTGKMDYIDFVIDIDGKLYLIKPRKAALSGDGEFLNVFAVMPERTMNHAEIVGWAVKCARMESGMSREEVADRAGIKAMTIEKIEEGRFLANVVMLGRVAEAMNMEISFRPIE